MAGFGFLRQMSETFKYNRDLLAKEKRKSFDNGIYKSKGNQTGLNEKQLTALEREKLIAEIKESNKRETRKRFLMLLLAIILLPVLGYCFIMIIEFLINLG